MPTPSSPAPGEEESQSRSIAAVERAMDVLLHFGRTDQPDLGVTEIATALGLTKAAVHRILTALRSRELITVDPATRRYALGHAAVVDDDGDIVLFMQADAAGRGRDIGRHNSSRSGLVRYGFERGA